MRMTLGLGLMAILAAPVAALAFSAIAFADQLTPASTADAPLMFAHAPIEAPIEAPIGAAFGSRIDPFTQQRAFHAGLDFLAPEGTRVVAPADGVVSMAGVRAGYGQVVEIDHGDGVKTRLAHLSRFDVQIGDAVRAGDLIGLSGSSGRATGGQLHFEVWRNGRATDPAASLPH